MHLPVLSWAPYTYRQHRTCHGTCVAFKDPDSRAKSVFFGVIGIFRYLFLLEVVK